MKDYWTARSPRRKHRRTDPLIAPFRALVRSRLPPAPPIPYLLQVPVDMGFINSFPVPPLAPPTDPIATVIFNYDFFNSFNEMSFLQLLMSMIRSDSSHTPLRLRKSLRRPPPRRGHGSTYTSQASTGL